MYSLESPHRGDSNEYTQHTIIVWKIEQINLNYRHLLPEWFGTIINPQWLEPPMSRTNFHGPKDVRAIEIRLYLVKFWNKYSKGLRYSTIQDKYGYDLTFSLLSLK